MNEDETKGPKNEDPAPPAKPSPQLTLALLPEDIEHESAAFEKLMGLDVDKLATIGVDKLSQYIKARAQAIRTVRDIAITITDHNDWTLYRSRDDKVIGCLRDSGATKVRPWYGVSVRNHRGVDGKAGVATRTVEEKKKNGAVEQVEVLEMLADVYVRGELVDEGIYMSVRSDDQFIGRANRDEKHGGPRRQDLRACLRTMLDTKATRSASGLNKVPGYELEHQGVDLAKCHHGSGYGTSGERAAERGASQTADAGIPGKAEELWMEMVKRTAGTDTSPNQLLLECTKVEASGKRRAFDGRKSHKSFTEQWQLDAAWKGLREHPAFGDAEMKQ